MSERNESEKEHRSGESRGRAGKQHESSEGRLAGRHPAGAKNLDADLQRLRASFKRLGLNERVTVQTSSLRALTERFLSSASTNTQSAHERLKRSMRKAGIVS
jgi:hypothetical protein